MFIGIVEGCASCVSIQTCTECKCSGEVTAPVNPDLWQHDADVAAEDRDGTPADAIAKRVAPGAVSPPPDPMESYQQMVEEPETVLEGFDGVDLDPANLWMGGVGGALIAGSFLLKQDGVRDVVRGLGIVIAGMGAAGVVGALSRK